MATWAGALLITALSSISISTPGCGIVRTQTIEHTFPTAEAAVRTLARARLESSVNDDREWVGGVLRTKGGRYRISEGAGCSGQDTVTFSVPLSDDHELVAFWHTHGRGGVARSYFSPHDAQVVAQTGKDFYLMTPRGELKILTAEHVRVGRNQYAGMSLDADHAVAFEA